MLNEPSDLGSAGLVADAFASADAARMAELDRLIKTGKGNDTPKEGTMPRGKPSEKRTCCESNGTRHLSTCPTQGKAPPKREKVVELNPVSTIARAMRGAPSVVVAQLDVDQLLQLVGEARKELERRRDQARSLVSKLETAIEELTQ